MAKRYRWNNGNPPTHFPSGKKIPKKLRDKLRKEYKRIHEQGIISRFDLDKDGVPNKIDCNPYDPNKDFFGGMPSEHPTLLRGYNVEDYYYTNRGYELMPGAKKEKKGFFSRMTE